MSEYLNRSMRWTALALGAFVMGGCVLTPSGTVEERAKAEKSGAAYRVKPEERNLPELGADPTWQDVLHRAFLANGDLEAAYFEWKAALDHIDVAGAYPNTNVSVGFQYMFSSERMKSWDRTTVSVAPDPMQNLSLPIKTMAAAKVALDQAREAVKFSAAKFDLQRNVLTSWLDLALMEEKLRIERDNVSLLKLLSESAADRVKAGAPQQDLLKAQIEYRLAENELAKMESSRKAMLAMLNAMLARPTDAPLKLPATLPSARPVVIDDAALIATAADRNPELAGFAQRVAGRRDALELARLAYFPDINPTAGFTGGISQFAGAMISLPLTMPMIRGAVNEAGAMLQSSEAMARQARADQSARFVAALYAMRNAEREATLFREVILPKAQQALESSRQSYGAAAINFIELIDSQRTLLEVRQMMAEAQVQREKHLAELEALMGVDAEALGKK